mmetsp:Transcript_138908/g.443526  ORF Transcript_138908/g.443526 Transcript_138908/m.443526 type:complete len:258 (+) Transcript_138908:1076-1849(+)
MCARWSGSVGTTGGLGTQRRCCSPWPTASGRAWRCSGSARGCCWSCGSGPRGAWWMPRTPKAGRTRSCATTLSACTLGRDVGSTRRCPGFSGPAQRCPSCASCCRGARRILDWRRWRSRLASVRRLACGHSWRRVHAVLSVDRCIAKLGAFWGRFCVTCMSSRATRWSRRSARCGRHLAASFGRGFSTGRRRPHFSGRLRAACCAASCCSSCTSRMAQATSWGSWRSGWPRSKAQPLPRPRCRLRRRRCLGASLGRG